MLTILVAFLAKFNFRFIHNTLTCWKYINQHLTMKFFQLPTLLITTVLTTLLISCSTPKELEYRDFKNFTIDKLGFSATSIKMDLIYYNPNNFGLQLKSSELDIFLDNNYLGHSVQEQLVSIPRRDEFSIPIKIDVDMKNLLKNGMATLLRNEVLVKVTGTLKVGKANLFKTLPVNYEGRQKFTIF